MLKFFMKIDLLAYAIMIVAVLTIWATIHGIRKEANSVYHPVHISETRR